jgi:hypothetical protein
VAEHEGDADLDEPLLVPKVIWMGMYGVLIAMSILSVSVGRGGGYSSARGASVCCAC